MSIIQEALQKVQNDMTSGVGSPDASAHKARKIDASSPYTKHRKSAADGNRVRVIHVALAVVILLAVIAALGAMFFHRTENKSEEMQMVEPKDVTVPQPPVPIESNIASATPDTAPSAPRGAPQPLPDKNPDFVLGGIMDMEDAPQAIINNAIVEEGDIVDGATVLKITEREVILKQDKSEIVLRMK